MTYIVKQNIINHSIKCNIMIIKGYTKYIGGNINE